MIQYKLIMRSLLVKIRKRLLEKEELPIGWYSVRVVSVAEELNFPKILPLEVRFVMAKDKTYKKRLSEILENGKALGVRTVEKTPKRVLEAVNHISTLSQHNTIITWLPSLLKTQQEPNFTKEDVKKAKQKGVDLYKEVAAILKHRLEFKKIVLIDEENQGSTIEEQQLIRNLNETLFPVAIDYIINRIIYDNAHERTETAQSVIRALLIVGPIAHILEEYTRGVGKVFAASTDDVLAETAELLALRGSGFTWRQLYQRSKILLPVFIAATYAAFSVEGFIEKDRYFTAGFLFGLSAVALSLTTAIQSIKMYHESVKKLVRDAKINVQNTREEWIIAFKQDFTNPARLGLFLGALTSPIVAAGIFAFLPEITHNGWVLALLGTTESLVAGFTVILAKKLNTFRFRQQLLEKIADL